jgi:hypothetical protein
VTSSTRIGLSDEQEGRGDASEFSDAASLGGSTGSPQFALRLQPVVNVMPVWLPTGDMQLVRTTRHIAIRHRHRDTQCARSEQLCQDAAADFWRHVELPHGLVGCEVKASDAVAHAAHQFGASFAIATVRLWRQFDHTPPTGVSLCHQTTHREMQRSNLRVGNIQLVEVAALITA